MNPTDKTKEELYIELQELQTKYNALKTIHNSSISSKELEELRKKSDELDNYFSGALDLFCIANTDGIFLKLNKEWENTLGYKVEELIGKRFLDMVHPDDLQMTIDTLSALSDQKPVLDFSNRYKSKDGTYRTIEWRSKPSGDLIYAAARDITDRIEAVKILEQTRQNYESFFNTIDEFLFVLDEHGNIIHTNSTVTDRLGFTQEELIGKSVLLMHPSERREEAVRIVGEMLRGEADFCPVPVITKSGILIPVETKASPGFWDGKPVIFGVAKDISKVRFSEEKFAKVFYLNPSACGLCDLENHKYIEVNDAFNSLLGYEKNEVIGKTALELGILSKEASNEISRNSDLSGKVTNVEADLTAKNGTVKHVMLSAEIIIVQDKKYRYTVVQDITERKEFEGEILFKNQELQKLNAEKDKFFSIIAHDLRSPFNGFLGLTQIMAEQLSSLTMDELQKIAESMRNSATNLFRLLDNLLHWACMKQGSIPFEPEIVLLLPVAEESIAMMIEPAKNKKIELNCDISEALQVFADSNMLQTIIRNLISNAVKFTHVGGKVSLSARLVDGKNVEIHIKDTGVGMDKSIVENLFRLDVQTNRRGTEGEPSTGLGLYLCKELIEKHGGKIWVISETDKGSEFIFTLPVTNFSS